MDRKGKDIRVMAIVVTVLTCVGPSLSAQSSKVCTCFRSFAHTAECSREAIWPYSRRTSQWCPRISAAHHYGQSWRRLVVRCTTRRRKSWLGFSRLRGLP